MRNDDTQQILRKLDFLTEKVELVHNAVHRTERMLDLMATDLTRLTNEVAETGTAIDSAIVLINGLAQQIRDLSTDPAALNALADSLDSKANELASAVTANTPAEVPPPAEEPPV